MWDDVGTPPTGPEVMRKKIQEGLNR